MAWQSLREALELNAETIWKKSARNSLAQFPSVAGRADAHCGKLEADVLYQRSA
ncbi:UNVERIFIED_CONTAM: hypothetical protein HHA_449480 [Hammondia hammondi]|eukprot:XP_008882159.1 hypothetical protein HHA_449480 [Hammondia hammondi]